MARPLSVTQVLIISLSLYILSTARRVERAIAGLWAMRGSKRRNTGGGSGPLRESHGSVQRNLDPGTYPTAGPCSIASLNRNMWTPDVYTTVGPCSNASLQRNLGSCCAVCNIQGVPPLKWLENDNERQPPPLSGALYCTSTRRASSRYAGETGTRKPPEQIIREVFLCDVPAHVHPARAACCCWNTACSLHPARSADWPHGPCLALAPCILESNS